MEPQRMSSENTASSATSDSRRFKRYLTQVPAFYQSCTPQGVPDEPFAHQGLAEDFSETGFKLRGFPKPAAEPEEAVEEAWHLRITLTMPDGAVCAVCRVRYVLVQEGGDPDLSWVYGLEVAEQSEADRARLKKLCLKARLMEEPR